MKSATAAIAFVALWSAAAAFAADVYRCETNGKVSYRDKPCGSDASASVVRIEPPPPTSTAPDEIARAAANNGRVVAGQTAAQVEMVLGRPESRNIDSGTRGYTEQWVYRQGDDSTYVYFRDGKVSSVNEHRREDGRKPPGSSPISSVAPTVAEIEQAERANKAGERRFVSKGAPSSDLLRRLGPPQSKDYVNGGECWNYSPDVQDSQTRTRICFANGIVYDVERSIQR